MSNLNPEGAYSDLTSVLEFAFNQMLKDVWTACPGVVVSYNDTTKRAQVKPAIRTLLSDGTHESRPTVVNVPVVHPSGGGFMLHVPVKPGDAVIMMFSRRGISKFKTTFAESDPDDGFYDLKDAMVLPGFGALNVSPATSDGITMQTEDGSNHIYVDNGNIVATATSKITLDAPEIEINSNLVTINSTVVQLNTDTFENNDVNVGDDHVHSGVQTGPSNTGGPQ